MRSIHIKTFGCQMNVYDSDRMTSLLVKEGYRIEPVLREADVILLNTCSIRDKAEHKVLSLLGELKGLKTKKPSTVIGITGCVGQRMGRTLLQKVPHLDLVMGPDSIDRVTALIDEVVENGRRVVEAKLDTDGRTYAQPSVVFKGKPSELLTIMKGCDHFCTYCIVPFVRGREKSRSIAEIIEDVRKFVQQGTREITFLGQNINTYGKGTPENLSQLIEAASRVEGLDRIRYVTSHPRDLGEDLIEQFGSVDKLCPALHLPFQAGSDAVLKRMSRLYTRAEYLTKVDKLRAACPDLALSTDVIVGFPGETDTDFELTLDVLNQVGFSSAYMFKYSPRPGTRAFDYSEGIPEAVKEERLARAQAVALAHIGTENRSKVGTTVSCLVESMDRKNRYWTGRTLHNQIVHVLNAGDACQGKIIDVEITEGNNSNLKGYYGGAPRRNRTSENSFSAPVSVA
jgi:tRNA-2-methylthio-N6-dimethylallyladenosine synthase